MYYTMNSHKLFSLPLFDIFLKIMIFGWEKFPFHFFDFFQFLKKNLGKKAKKMEGKFFLYQISLKKTLKTTEKKFPFHFFDFFKKTQKVGGKFFEKKCLSFLKSQHT